MKNQLSKLIKVISINIHNLLLWVFEIGDAHYIFDDSALAEISIYNRVINSYFFEFADHYNIN